MVLIIVIIVIILIIIAAIIYFVMKKDTHFADEDVYDSQHHMDFYKDIDAIETLIIGFDTKVINQVPEMTQEHKDELYGDAKVIANKYKMNKTYNENVTRDLLSGGIDNIIYDITTSVSHILLQYRSQTEINHMLEPMILLRKELLQIIGKTPIHAVTFGDMLIHKDTRTF